MKRANRIFIGYDSRFPVAYDVLEYSILKHASIPLEIQPLDIGEIEFEYDFKREHDPLQSTEFTYLRFLVPFLCNYEGTALYLDNDMLCLADIKTIFNLDMSNLALRVRKHNYESPNSTKMYGCEQTNYPRKNWSSMMLMNCSKLQIWSKAFVEKASGAELHRFYGIPDELIGDLPEGWNDLTNMSENCKLLHYTEGGPWFPEYINCPHADIWQEHKSEIGQ